MGNPLGQTNYTARLLQFKLGLNLTLLPFELIAKNGIGLGLGGITRGEMSSRFLLDLKKLDNTMSFCEIVGVCIALQFKKMYTKKEAKGGWETQSRQVCEHHYWFVHKIPTSKVLSKIEHASAPQESPYSHNSKTIAKFLNSHNAI